MATFTPICERTARAVVGDLDIGARQKPLAYALIHCLLHKAQRSPRTKGKYELLRGDVLTTIPDLASDCGVSQQSVKTLLNHMEGVFLTAQSTAKKHIITIVDFDTYVIDSGPSQPQPQPQTNRNSTGKLTADQPPPLDNPPIRRELLNTTEQPSVRDSTSDTPTNGLTPKQKLDQLCEKHPEVPRILKDNWLAHLPLPKSAQTPTAKLRIANTIRLLHTADGYPWPRVGKIVEHAATVWAPKGMIGSPASLRELTTKKDRRCHEAIASQLDSDVPSKDGLDDLRKAIG